MCVCGGVVFVFVVFFFFLFLNHPDEVKYSEGLTGQGHRSQAYTFSITYLHTVSYFQSLR